ncbi:hypothetical protein [Legionella longbeachae]|uniref:AAA+ ATPase domain-containing protein n=1 Tax=Legionella longbeachae serogroup 1 (strain NSW150) TaxID=661367 RepID=D3HSA8_LEGLN|nr:hypothetical protein [Legionella longbeachae]VEE02291.1 AAA domain (dynein-related subfamily) [Legionella oakridgensis]HBD7398219.1 hypothetical protein [Legionella pneumophila]ARB91419.1 hypothetical protein A6J40_04105 [Legionella longbeachae]QIN32157.1 hypothetical protein GCB94_08380 [Legionella longbeachae]QIN35505.1 hypothetical protein GCS73_07620 [Legionella longbeachae]
MSTSKIELLIDKTMRKCFYYQYSDEQQTYSTIPSGGEIDSDKLRQKDPKFWVSRSLNEKSIPKNLIINDIFLSYRSKNEVEQLKNILSELINQKFPIFLWQKGSLVPLNQDNLSQLDNNEIIESITQAYPDSIIKLAVQNHRLTKNSILLLDDYWVSQLLENNKKPQERAIYASIWKKLDDSSKIEALEILTKSSPKLTQFIDDIFPEDGEVIPPVQMDLKRVKRYKIITIQAGENNLETISNDMLAKKIDVNFARRCNEFLSPILSFSDQVRSLNFTGSLITGTQLSQLLSKTPHVETLVIKNCNKLGEADDFSSLLPKSLINIRSIDLSGTSITAAQLSQLLLAAPNIETINLSKCRIIGAKTQLSLPPQCLAKLKSLNLEESYVTAKQELLFAAPNLETLNLSWSGKLQLTGSLSSQPECLGKLKSLILRYSFISKEELHELVRAAPNLEKLDLFMFEKLDLTNLLSIQSGLTNLKSFSVDDRFTEEHFEQLVRIAPNIELEDVKILYLEADPNGSEKFLSDCSDNSDRATSPEDSHFNVKEFLTFIPKKSEEFSFPTSFSGNHQGMIVAKFSQYLMNKAPNQHKTLVQAIQDGMCVALSTYFIQNLSDFNGFFERIVKWDPINTPNPPKELENDFNQLIDYVNRVQLKQHRTSIYLGKKWVESLIEQVKQPIVLHNPWHAIALEPPTPPLKTTWTVYDPNYINGPKNVSDKDLKKTIKLALGSANLTVESHVMKPNSPLSLSKHFLSTGGLLTLCEVQNRDNILSQCKNVQFSADELSDGLFLRDTNGIPAWFWGINHHSPELRIFTKQLLKEYKQSYCNGDNLSFEESLKKSIEHLSPEQMHKIKRSPSATNWIAQLVSDSTPDKATEDNRSKHIKTQTQSQKQLEQWCVDYLQSQSTPTQEYEDLTQYCKEVLSAKNNTLISCNTDTKTQMLQLEVFQKAKVSGHPVYLIDSPEDLLCSVDYIDENGKLQKGPGGPLYHFLKENKDRNPTLLINYDRFKDSDFVRFNSLLDPDPTIDGVVFRHLFKDSVPNTLEQGKTQFRVIGFRNSANPDCYNESDFTSRMQNKLSAFKDIPPVPQLEHNLDHDVGNKAVINLFHSPYWKTELLGQWVPDGDGFRFKEGLLEKVLKSTPIPQTLVINNGLESNAEYQAFWQKALVLGSIQHQGKNIVLPGNLKLLHQTGYNWNKLSETSLTCYSGQGSGEVINPSRFNNLFKRYICDNEQLIEQKGLIEEAAQRPGKELTLNISRALSEDQWAKLLTQADEAKLKLTVYLAEGVRLPEKLLIPIHNIEETPVVDARDRFYPVSHSKEETQKQIKQIKQFNNPLVIDVSEAQASDLIKRLTLKDTKTGSLVFQEEEGALIKALKEKQVVILKGQIPAPLMDELHALLHERRNEPNATGNLIVMPTTLNPKSDLSDFHTLSNSPPKQISAQTFMQDRIDACNSVLKNNPYVFLSGLSGVGKTSFIESEFCGRDKHKLHFTLEEWLKANDSSSNEHYQILFIDEANIGQRDFSEFQDLFNTPPSLLYKGNVHVLSPQHKVVFAGNPLSYGEGRTLPSLFQEHGNAVVFTPLPNSVIKERILNPIFEGSSLEKEVIESIQQHLLEVYNTLCRYSDTKILISPRELQMMALLTRSYCEHQEKTDQNANPKEAVKHFAYKLALPLVPQEHQQDFKQNFKPLTTLKQLIKPSEPSSHSSFCITASRLPIEQSINQLFLLRQQRRKEVLSANPAQLYGGLGGLVLEGNPGVGKSEFLIHLLRSWGLKECSLSHKESLDTQDEPSNHFYRIPAEYSIKQKKDLLRKAFHEGAVVIMDEINSSPMMEQFLNHLLMGKDDAGEHPRQPGFILLGTQNPATLSGRRQASEALNRRLQTIHMPEYPVSELAQILQTKNITKEEAEILGQQWNKKYQNALAIHQKPPTFRDLINMAGYWREISERNNKLVDKHKICEDVTEKAKVVGVEDKAYQLSLSIKNPSNLESLKTQRNSIASPHYGKIWNDYLIKEGNTAPLKSSQSINHFKDRYVSIKNIENKEEVEKETLLFNK